jgi:Flp pilus assembly protein TadB
MLTRSTRIERRPITMFWIIALALFAVLAVVIVGFAVHLLFTPWLLVIIAIVAWMMLRTRRSRR